MTGLSVGDRLALSDLVDRYAAHVDDRDFDSLGALFTDDAVLRQPRPPRRMEPTDDVRGRESIVANFARLRDLRATQHAVVGRAFAAASGTAPDAASPAGSAVTEATGRIACIAHHVSGADDRPVDHAWHLTYRDLYRRNGDAWLIAERTLQLHWIETRSVGAVRDR